MFKVHSFLFPLFLMGCVLNLILIGSWAVCVLIGVYQCPMVVRDLQQDDQSILDPEDKEQVCICWPFKNF